jgi:tetratricopeptide (TPR) repeat protein
MFRTIAMSIVIVFSSALGGCTATTFSYEDNGWKDDSPKAQTTDLESPMEGPGRARTGSPAPQEPEEEELDWSDLTQLARDHQRRREYERAHQRLDQAAVLVSGRSPTDASRRAVFGIRARFAEQLGNVGEIERADALSDQLLAEAEAEPEIAGASFVSLALSLAERRTQSDLEAAEAGRDSADGEHIETPSQLPLLEVALGAAQAGSASRQRFTLAARIAEDAYNQDRFEVARVAVDQALADISILSPNNQTQITLLLLQRSRIATASGDLEVAIADATRANQLLEELDASAASRGYGEATLAEALAKRGDTERAVAIARGARARLDGEEKIDEPTQRVILCALARVEFAMGDLDRSRRTYDEALAIPADGSDRDRHLIREMRAERSALVGSASE